MRRGSAAVGVALAVLCGTFAGSAGAQKTDGGEDGPRSTAAERAQRQAGLELLTYVPGSYDQGCLIETDADIAGSALVAPYAASLEAYLVCRTDDEAIVLHAFKLDSEAAVNGYYDSYTPEGLDPSINECGGDGTWGDGTGRLKCYGTVDEGSAIVWTFPSDGLVFAAFRHDRDFDALNAWWSESGPPVDDRPAPTKLVSDVDWTRNADLLRKSVPKELRRTCRNPRISADELGELFRDRLTLRTVLFCHPGSAADRMVVVDFQFREGAEAYVEAFAPLADEETPRAQSGGVDCEGSGTWSRGSSRKTAGDYVCFFNGAGGVAIVWSDDKQGIALSVGRDDGDAEKLIRFYNQKAGPVPNPGLASSS
jgi:hypothetical protein